MTALRHLMIGGLAIAVGLSGLNGVRAQTASKPEKTTKAAQAPEAAPAKPETPSNAPYMRPLGRLAAILGSLHFLRGLCGDPNAGVWRDRMNDLIASQAPNAADKEILIASFNGGYRAFASVYRRCTPAARTAVARYQDEGAVLGRDIAARYGS